MTAPSLAPSARPARSTLARGVLLVALAAVIWSLGGTISRFIAVEDNWTIVFWRATFAMLYLAGFLLLREGVTKTRRQFNTMGWPGLVVALCFAVASIAFVVALSQTTVANILFIQASVPLIAALLGWFVFRERVGAATWLAIAAVVLGIGVMVSGSLTGAVSPVGDALALLIAISFSIAIVITRRYDHVAMIPATCLGMAIAATIAAIFAQTFIVSAADFAALFAFGALSLGLGLSVFAIGARLAPATVVAVVSTIEPVVGPIWVWLVHGETPGWRALIGGAIILAAILANIAIVARSDRQSA
jgi:drug/metabolite transporter (DMT)-like permease